ncbi:MAG: HAD family hydrolase [Mucilaginibacter sp.]
MKAFIFDLNGTMINDMEYHTKGWMYVLNNDLGGNFDYARVKQEMYGKNSEVLTRFFGPDRFTEDELTQISEEKERRYREAFLPELELLPGLQQFLQNAKEAGIKMAVASAAIPSNIDFVLDGLHIRHYFDAIVSAHDVVESKPHPETFLKAAELLNVSAENCLVFEDAPKGAEAAQNANMKAVVLTTTHEAAEFMYLDNVVSFWKDYADKSNIISLVV